MLSWIIYKLSHRHFWILLFMGSVALSAVDPLTNPSLYDKQEIQVRGFLYMSETGEMVLSSNPGLRSCCVASPTRIDEQIFIKGKIEMEPIDHVVTLEGIFKIDPIKDLQGQYIQYYILEDAHKVAEKSFPVILISALVALLLVAAVFIFRLRQS